MKKNIYILFLTFFSISTFGQVIPKGTRFLGGDLSFGYTQSNVSKDAVSNSLQIGISPSYSQFIKDNFSVTYSLTYVGNITGSKSAFSNHLEKYGVHTVGAGLFFRNYKMLSEKLGVSIQYGAHINYLFSAAGSTDDDGAKVVSLNISAGPGIIYLLNEKFAIEGTTSLVNLRAGYTWLGDATVFNIGTGLSGSPGLGIGFRYFLK
jgi:hypothetical protein